MTEKQRRHPLRSHGVRHLVSLTFRFRLPTSEEAERRREHRSTSKLGWLGDRRHPKTLKLPNRCGEPLGGIGPIVKGFAAELPDELGMR